MVNKTKTALVLTTVGSILIPTIAYAVTAITRHVNGSAPQDTSRSWRRALPGETYGSPNEEGKLYLPFHGGWQPWPQIGDTILNETWNGNNKAYGKVVLDEDVSKGLELFYDDQTDTLLEHAPNIRKLIDETGLPGQVLAVSYKNSNPSLQCTTALDTALNGHFFHAYPIGALDIEPGDSVTTEFTKGSTMVPVSFAVDTNLGQAQLIADTVRLQSTGVKEGKSNKLENLVIRPNPAKNHIVFGKKFKGFLYDVTGKKVSSIDIDKGHRLDLKDIPTGIYYIMGKRTELEKPKSQKVIIVK